MASQSTNDPMEASPDESLMDSEVPEEHFPVLECLPEESFAPIPPRGMGTDSLLLLTTGFFLAVGGLALAAAPQYSWQVVKISRLLAGMGIESGTLLVGGLLLFALGLVLRAVVFHGSQPGPEESDEQSDFSLIAEQLATDLARVRHSVLQVTEEVVGMSESQATFLQEQRAEAALEEKGPQHDAVFRLAASLDQLNARVDERLHHMDVQLRGHFQGVGDAIRDSREAMDARMCVISAQVQAQGVDSRVPIHSEAPSLAGLATEDEELEIVVDLEQGADALDESTMEFFETIEDLDELVSGIERETAAQQRNPTLDFDGLDLGELGLDEEPMTDLPPAMPDSNGESTSLEDPLDALFPDDVVGRAFDPESGDGQ